MNLDRSVAPPAYPLEYLRLPSFQVSHLSTGVPILTLTDLAHPIIFLEFISRNGRWAESKPGISHLTTKMLLEGTSHLSSEEISFGFEKLGSFIDINSGLDHVSIKLYCLKKHLDASLKLLLQLFTDSQFPEAEFETLKSIRMQQLDMQLSRNSHLATLSFNQHLFGENHPYGRIVKSDQVNERTVEEIREFFKHSFFSDLKLVAAGDMDDSVVISLDQFVAQIPVQKSNASEFLIQTKPGRADIAQKSEQASIRMGGSFISKKDPMIHQATIANSLLGGYFGSRLMKVIREEKGLTYGIHSSIIHTSQHSYWVISSEVQKDKIEEAITEINRVVTDCITKPPGEKELTTLKSYLKGKLLMSMDSILTVSSMYKSLFVHGLDQSYFENYLTTLEEVNSQQLALVIQRYFKADLSLVVS